MAHMEREPFDPKVTGKALADQERSKHEEALSRALSTAKEEMDVFGLDEVGYAKKRLKSALLTAILTIAEISETADQDTPYQITKLRFDAAKYIVDRAFGSISPTTGEFVDKDVDPVEAFIANCIADYEADA